MIDDEDMLEELHRGPSRQSFKSFVLALVFVWTLFGIWLFYR